MPYQDLKSKIFDIAVMLKDEHDYVFYFLAGMLNSTIDAPVYSKFNVEEQLWKQLGACIYILRFIPALQEMYLEILSLTQNKSPDINSFSSEIRFQAVLLQYPVIGNTVLKKGIMIEPHSEQNAVEYTIIETLDDMLFFEYSEMLKREIYIKKCKLCGRYFILRDKRKREYCDRIYADGKTCKEVGAKILHEKVIKENEDLLAYRREYNRNYSRMYRAEGKLSDEMNGKDMTREEFDNWKKNNKSIDLTEDKYIK